MNTLERIRSALEQKHDLAELVLELKRAGVSQREIYDNLEAVRQELSAQGREPEEDYVMEIQDRVWGFCSTQNRLFDTSLSRSDFESSSN